LDRRISDARPEDAESCARLILLSASEFLPFMFSDRIRRVLVTLLSRPANLFSHEHVRVIRTETAAAGMLLGYSDEQQRREELRTGMLLFGQLGFSFLRRLPRLLRAQGVVNYLAKGEFYLSNLAVGPEFCRQGLGRELVGDAQQQARSLGCGRIVLDVETDNQGAIGFYERLGFERAGEAHRLRTRRHQFAFLRLVRRIAA
jgi:ribosomal protein S18 acetylase RimI-like enzyme